MTWWLPSGADEYVLPISAGVMVDTSRPELMRWLRQGSPWALSELPVLGVRYADRMIVVIVPWPHYAELVVEDRLGIRFLFPQGRHKAAACEIVAVRSGTDPLEVARVFREWRRTSTNTGAIPRPRPLTEKAKELPGVSRLFGAPHIYLWGPALFSRHDVPRANWLEFARALQEAPGESLRNRIVKLFTGDQRRALRELAEAEWPMRHLTVDVAAAVEDVLANRTLLNLPAETASAEVISRNRKALAHAFADFVHPPESWGDGPSVPMLDELRDAGINRALLVLSDLYSRSPRPDVAAHANQLGYLLGPYDSYHSVHSPEADPASTWETAQFDRAAYEQGRVLSANGLGHRGFRGKGYHFSPLAAWPYVQERVNRIISDTPYSAWFIDCDATAESFDDYSPGHEATRVDDVDARRRRLHWLESEHELIVGSEGGSVLFADATHFGHGTHTPYIGHLDAAFRDRESPYFLGSYWPPDTPENAFKAVPVPPSLVTPYFDPTVRVPLYRAALGDEVIVSHHWSFDSLKFDNVATTRELFEILYMVPPMYHLNRETWPKRRDRILQHLAFWAPLHRDLASAPLIRFEWLSEDRLVQRTAFRLNHGDVTITVNFGTRWQGGYPPYSATVSGRQAAGAQRVYRAQQR
ncbi:MAG: glycoside hydrolase [Acidobacteriota bacterium]